MVEEVTPLVMAAARAAPVQEEAAQTALISNAGCALARVRRWEGKEEGGREGGRTSCDECEDVEGEDEREEAGGDDALLDGAGLGGLEERVEALLEVVRGEVGRVEETQLGRGSGSGRGEGGTEG